MTRTSRLLLALLAPLLPTQETPPHDADHPGPRAPVAGILGFQSVSKIDFGTQQNRLTAVYLFPDRVRWHFENYAEQRSEHQFYYRQGRLVHLFAGAGPSQAMSGEEHDAVILQMELRRAAMLWPDGFDWSDTIAGKRTASVYADSCCRQLPLGTLAANVLDDGRPRTLSALGADGQVLEELEIRDWQEQEGRSWPRTMTNSSPGGHFVETIEAIETRVHYLELSFLPPDRRPLPPKAQGPDILARDLVAMTYSTHTLPDGISWEHALAQARTWIGEAGASLRDKGLVVDPVPTFELSPAGLPLRCLVRLREAHLPPPSGYQTFSERAGLFVAIQDFRQVDAALLQRLRSATPESTRAGTVYLRLHERPNLPVEVVLPLETPE